MKSTIKKQETCGLRLVGTHLRKLVNKRSVTLDWLIKCKDLDNKCDCSRDDGKRKPVNRNGKKYYCDMALCLDVFKDVYYPKKAYSFKGTYGKEEK